MKGHVTIPSIGSSRIIGIGQWPTLLGGGWLGLPFMLKSEKREKSKWRRLRWYGRDGESVIKLLGIKIRKYQQTIK
jgi:hypothetical protein